MIFSQDQKRLNVMIYDRKNICAKSYIRLGRAFPGTFLQGEGKLAPNHLIIFLLLTFYHFQRKSEKYLYKKTNSNLQLRTSYL